MNPQSYGLPNPPIAGGGGGDAGDSVSDGFSGTATALTAGGKELTIHDTMSYLMDIRATFPNQREKYDGVLDIMKDFGAQRIDTFGLIARVKELFEGHPKLMLGLCSILPDGYQNTLTYEDLMWLHSSCVSSLKSLLLS